MKSESSETKRGYEERILLTVFPSLQRFSNLSSASEYRIRATKQALIATPAARSEKSFEPPRHPA